MGHSRKRVEVFTKNSKKEEFMKLSIGNLPQTLTEEALAALLKPYGNVSQVTIKRDKITKVSLGYGSAEMPDADGQKAIQALHGKEIEGKTIAVVNQEELAKSQKEVGKQKGNPNNQKPTFGRSQTGGGGSTGVQRRGGTRGS